jgi:hypothetical protein
VKHCARCHGTLTAESANTTFFDPNDATIVCTSCHDQVVSERLGLGETHGLSDQVGSDIVERLSHNAPVHVSMVSSRIVTHVQDERPLEDDTDMLTEPASLQTVFPITSNSLTSYHRLPTPPNSNTNKHMTSRTVCNTNIPSASIFQPQGRTMNAKIASSTSCRSQSFTSSPDPLVDITHLRVRSQGHHCLYPGASFQGTQKSGRNSYDVNVTIVDVDFASSFLCGYLRIRGLTDDWPELTTYFDAEIIGSRYGFLTQNWGANEQEDMVHWRRFPAFRHVKDKLKKPHLTMNDRDRGAVFMRWKERFLVPDHRVQDINGASFAGFYYVCVDFNPQPATSALRPVAQSMPLTPESDDYTLPPLPPAPKTETPQGVRNRRDSSVKRAGRAPSVGPRSATPVPTMSGFYFHQNSEPYQQLSLNHVPECTSSSFEFR